MWKKKFEELDDSKLSSFVCPSSYPKNIILNAPYSNSPNKEEKRYKSHKEQRRTKSKIEIQSEQSNAVTKNINKCNDQVKETIFLENDEKEDEFTWDPYSTPKENWTMQNICAFVSLFPQKGPKLLNISRIQNNPYKANPFYLCTFQAHDGEIELWMLGALLYNTPKYKKKFMKAKQMLMRE